MMLEVIRESRVHRFAAGILKGSARTLTVCLVVLLGRHLLLSAQTLRYTKRPDVRNGEKVYKGGCIACHGSDGKGAAPTSTVFARPDTFPDFTDCAGTTPEPNGNWKAVIVHGGPSRGLSQIMPAFGDLLTDDQINDVIAYMRGF
jgi:cytochrome c